MKDSLNSFIKELKSIQVQNIGKFDSLTGIDSITIVGSTCSGKSTVVDAVRDSIELKGLVDVPVRYITRSKRGNDNTVENIHLDEVEFQEKIELGDIKLHWVRRMEGDRKERYGFHKTDKNKLAVYSGNNALFNNPNSIAPRNVLKNTLMVGVYAPDKVRRERLIKRSPDLFKDNPDEVAYRLQDVSNNILPHVHITIDNGVELEMFATDEIVKLIKFLISKHETCYKSSNVV